ncbi:MAG: ATP-binding protein [Streptosporangiaceae bacterium]
MSDSDDGHAQLDDPAFRTQKPPQLMHLAALARAERSDGDWVPSLSPSGRTGAVTGTACSAAVLSPAPVPVLSSIHDQWGTHDASSDLPLHSHLELGAFPSAVPCARLHAKQVAWEWGLDELAEAIELLVSELATNAVQAVADRTHLAFIRLRLSSDTVRLLIEVWDADPRPPASTALTSDGIPPLDQEGGRGLFLVATLSQRWNWYPVPQWGGKVVWCEMDVQASRTGERRADCPDTAGRPVGSHSLSSDSAITHPVPVISSQPHD